jgi:hypothetical protein
VLYALDAYCVKYPSYRGRLPSLSARSTLVHPPTGPFALPRSKAGASTHSRGRSLGYFELLCAYNKIDSAGAPYFTFGRPTPSGPGEQGMRRERLFAVGFVVAGGGRIGPGRWYVSLWHG